MRIVDYSGDMFLIEQEVAALAAAKAPLASLIGDTAAVRVKSHLDRIDSQYARQSFPDEGWALRYQGPGAVSELGSFWRPQVDGGCRGWQVMASDSGLSICHAPHPETERDCCLMSEQEFGGASEDVKLAFVIRTPGDPQSIQGLTVILSGASAEGNTPLVEAGYAFCCGLSGNRAFGIQRQSDNTARCEAALEPGREYVVTAERVGGWLRLKVAEHPGGRSVVELRGMDSDAVYGKHNHVGFAAFSGRAEIRDVRIFTRPSAHPISDFQIPFDCKVELGSHRAPRFLRLRLRQDALSQHIGLMFEEMPETSPLEHAPAQERAHLTSIFDSINEPIYAIDINTFEVLYVNRYLRDLLGHDPVGKPCYSVLQSFSEPCEFCTNEQVKKLAGIPLKWEQYNRKLHRHFLITDRLINWPDGREARLELAIDTTQQKRAEKSLRESENRYKTIYEKTLNPIIIVDMNGIIFDCNRAASAFLEMSREGLKKKSLFAFLCNGDHMVAVIGQPARLWKRGQVVEAVFQVNGKRKLLDLALAPVRIGNRKLVLGVGRDITARKEAEQALAAEKERLAVTLTSIGDAVIATNREGLVSLLNPVAESLTGWKQEEAAGQPLEKVFRIINENTRQAVENPVSRVLRESHVIGLANHTVLCSRDGREFAIADSGAPICDTGQRIVGVVLVFRDVTQQRKMEEEIQKAARIESLGTLAGGIAHDFNNILTSIIGNISLARIMVETQPRLLDILQEAEKAGFRARDLTQQLLTFARGGAPVKEKTTLTKLLHETVDFSLRGTNVRAVYSIVEDLWSVEADAGQISQVLNNLVINAVQAMPEGGRLKVAADNVRIEGDEMPPLNAGCFIRIEVSDEGIGIPPEHQERIFDPYFTTKQRGSGLGLATCYSIIRKHGGAIEVQSRVGQGSTFRFLLPALNVPPVKASRDKKAGKPGVRRFDGKRVLVMDDESAVRKVARGMLEMMGLEVEEAVDGEEAQHKYRESIGAGRPFDLVILDLTVPAGAGGLEALNGLKLIQPRVCALVSSGYSNDPVMSDYIAHGFAGRLKKPYEFESLQQVIGRVLAGG
ncbi:PAS domain S-box protein [bacterium]|nr:PAS domain S-box protein [bacterium]